MRASRTHHLVATAALVLALVIVPALPAAAAGPTVSTNGDTTTIKVHEQETLDQYIPKAGKQQDFPAEDDFTPQVGDGFLFEGDLSQGGTKVGTDGGLCTATSVNTEQFSLTNSCRVTFTFPEGTLVAEDTITFSEDSDGGFDVKLVSGTGAYSGAKGNVHVAEEDCEENCELSASDLTLTFTTDGSQVTQVPTGGAAAGGGATNDDSNALLLFAVAGVAVVGGTGALAGGRKLAGARKN